MRRRDVIAFLAGAAAAGSVPAYSQGAEHARRVVLLMTLSAEDPIAQARVAAFTQGMQEKGWSVGGDLRLDVRWDARDADRRRRDIAEVVTSGPDVILSTGSITVGPLLQLTRTLPIVFVIVPDPIGAGFVETLARPGGNATGFLQFEYSLSGKWLEVLKEIVPGVERVGVLRDPMLTAAIAQFAVLQAVAPSLRVELVPLNAQNAAQIDQAITDFARSEKAGLVVTSSPTTAVYRDLIIAAVANHKLPTVYYERFWIDAGGLISYGPDFRDQYRNAAGYVDRILRGERPANLPVQAPAKYELAINLKTAKALGLTVPPTLFARADVVID